MTLELVIRRTLDAVDTVDRALRGMGLRYGEVIDLVREADLAEQAAEDTADRAREPPWSREARRAALKLYAHGFSEGQVDVLLGQPPGTTTALFVRQRPPRNVREVTGLCLAGLTAQQAADRLSMHPHTVRDAMAAVGLQPAPAQEDRRQAARYRPKVAALARAQIEQLGEPDVRRIVDDMARQGFTLTASQVHNALRAARKAGDLPPARKKSRGRL